MNDKVVIVGEPRDIDRAAKYIEKMMYGADQPKGRRSSIDDGTGSGEVQDGFATSPHLQSESILKPLGICNPSFRLL